MVMLMKRLEKLAGDFAKTYAKDWDYYCIATSGFMSGYREATQDCGLDDLGQDVVEVTLEDGDQQLSARSFKKWYNYNRQMKLDEAMKTYLKLYFEFDEIRVTTDNNGLISFQGTAKKVSF